MIDIANSSHPTTQRSSQEVILNSASLRCRQFLSYSVPHQPIEFDSAVRQLQSAEEKKQKLEQPSFSMKSQHQLDYKIIS